MLQQEDLVMFGKLVFALCCNNPSAVSNISKAMETLNRHYSQELKNVCLYLISKPTPLKVSVWVAHLKLHCLTLCIRVSDMCVN